MRKCFLHSVFILLLSSTCFPLCSQKLSFRYLGNAEGLNSTTAYGCTIDQHGFIWIATNDGLVRFDGKATKYFYQQDYPELPADQMGFVYCDHQNAVWACTNKGLARVDANLQVERQVLKTEAPDLRVYHCFETADSNIIALTAEGAYSRTYDVPHWERLPWLDSLIAGRRWWDIRRFDRDRFTIVLPSAGVMLINTTTKKLEAFIPQNGVNCAARFNAHSILIGGSGQFKLTLASIDSSFESRIIAPPTFFSQNDTHEEIVYMTRASDGKMYITTRGRGLICYDSTLTSITRYLHDPLDFSTIISNSLKYVAADDKGNLVITSLDGINYTNVNNTAADYFNYLRTEDGDIVHERILSLAEDKHHRLWLCARDQVYLYDPGSDITERMIIPASVKLKSEEIFPFHVERDRQDFMWVALRGEGILIYDPDGRFFRMLRQEDYPGFSTNLGRVRMMRDGEDGYMYVGSESGLFRIAHDHFTIDTFAKELPMAPLRRARIVDILPKKDGLWISSSPYGAAWHYTFADQKLTKLTTENGLSNNRIYGLVENGDGNVYVGTFNGFSIIHPDLTITNILKGEGLISSRIETIEAAEDGSIWMTNNYSILKYVPVTQKIYNIGARQGLRNINFVIMSSAMLESGKIAFGASKGFVIIDPNTIQVESKPIQVFLFLTDKMGKEREILPGTSHTFSYREQHLRFSFAVNDLMMADQVLYRYRLTSRDESSWSAPSQNAVVDFNLNPGQYSLEVEAFDGHSWVAYATPFHFRMEAPWWKKGWFLMVAALSVALGIWFIFKERINKYKKELEITRQIADLESKALRAQMNPHFVFNSLNAIQECIVTGKIDEAYTYLSKFSRLLRMVLEHSDMAEVSLQSEMEVLNLYVALEKLRFKDEMQFHFDVDEELDVEEILIPPMLIQPHLENAIWHGLRDQAGEKLLTVTIKEKLHGYLEVIIEDNGIGRVKADSLKKNRLGQQKHQSKGSKLSENRMLILKNRFPHTAISIEDLYEEQGGAKGTRVHLVVPILEKNMTNSNPLTP
jgi:ligand-binding sensor domain-containing protein